MTRLAFCFLAAALARGQQFEAVSVKPVAPGGEQRIAGGPGTSSPGQIVYLGQSLRTLVFLAYRLQFYQLTTPAWMDQANFDVVAKVPPGATPNDLRVMLQNLLAERFALKVHRESRAAAGYVLRPGKGGLRLKASPPLSPDADTGFPSRFDVDKDGFLVLPPGVANMITFPTGSGISRTTGGRQSMAALCTWLGRQLQQPVQDETGLAGLYDFRLAFATDSVTPLGRPRFNDAATGTDELRASDPAPTLPQAVEAQLGLKLELRNLPVDYLVIDHIERKPIEN
ncbi:MAG: TIGR03435 family protein [Candidatus Sulfopaludibacter sp.]|nr:TIGR03435 family protein [Candidatus Sulfopaludibacter sp.]